MVTGQQTGFQGAFPWYKMLEPSMTPTCVEAPRSSDVSSHMTGYQFCACQESPVRVDPGCPRVPRTRTHEISSIACSPYDVKMSCPHVEDKPCPWVNPKLYSLASSCPSGLS